MLSGFGRERACVMERAMREEYERLRQQAALEETFTFNGYTKDQLEAITNVIDRNICGALRNMSPTQLSNLIYKKLKGRRVEEPKPMPKTKEELAEHLYYIAMGKAGSVCCPDWEKSSDTVRDKYRAKANDLIVENWEHCQ